MLLSQPRPRPRAYSHDRGREDAGSSVHSEGDPVGPAEGADASRSGSAGTGRVWANSGDAPAIRTKAVVAARERRAAIAAQERRARSRALMRAGGAARRGA